MSMPGNTYDENATPDSIPGYTTAPLDTGVTDQSGDGGGSAGTDSVTTQPDPVQYQSALTAMTALPGDMLNGLRTSVNAADTQARQSAPTGFNPLAEPAGTPQAPAPVNKVSGKQMSGFIAASLTWADNDMISSLQAAATKAGPQAALMAQTITVDVHAGIVKAGGTTPVGRHSVPASALIRGSQGGAAQFAHNSPWFFPAVNAWAAANPPPTLPPVDGTLPMEGPPA